MTLADRRRSPLLEAGNRGRTRDAADDLNDVASVEERPKEQFALTAFERLLGDQRQRPVDVELDGFGEKRERLLGNRTAAAKLFGVRREGAHER